MGLVLYNTINKKGYMKLLYVIPIVFLFSNNICYFITIYIFKEPNFNFVMDGNIFIFKYSILNIMITIIVVVIVSFIEKYIEVRVRVIRKNEKNK